MAPVGKFALPGQTRQQTLHYHTILSGILQIRFAHLCRLLAIVCWITTVFLGSFAPVSWIWCILPFRAIPIFFSVFIILIYHKAYLHVNYITYPTFISQLYNTLISKSFIVGFLTYSISSIVYFSFIKFQISYKLNINLNIKTIVEKYDHQLPNLNEKFIYYYFFAINLAFLISFIHFVFDQDRLPLSRNPSGVNPRMMIARNMKHITLKAFLLTILTTITTPILYIIFRRRIWVTSLSIFRKILTISNRNNNYEKYNNPILSLKFIFILSLSSFIINFLFEFTTLVFTSFMSIGCIHRNIKVSEKSNDPNGTLITGLRSIKRPFTRITAFQELNLICFNDDESKRRIEIFKDIERPNTIWNEILKEFKLILKSTIENFEKELNNNNKLKNPKSNEKNNNNIMIEKKKQINKNVLLPTKHKLIESFQDDKAIKSNKIVSVISDSFIGFKSIFQTFSKRYEIFLNSNFGSLFRHTIHRKLEILCPNPILVSYSIISISLLIIRSYDEDNYGIVQKDIPTILNDFNNAILILEKFKLNPIIHWTDINSKKLIENGQKNDISMKIVDLLLDSLKSGFHDIVFQFVDYLDNLDLSENVKQMAFEVLNE